MQQHQRLSQCKERWTTTEGRLYLLGLILIHKENFDACEADKAESIRHACSDTEKKPAPSTLLPLQSTPLILLSGEPSRSFVAMHVSYTDVINLHFHFHVVSLNVLSVLI